MGPARKAKTGSAVSGLAKEKGAKDSTAAEKGVQVTQPVIQPQRSLQVHGDVNEYEYDLAASIDIGALGDNIITNSNDFQGLRPGSPSREQDVEEIVDLTAPNIEEDMARDLRALLEDYERQEGAKGIEMDKNESKRPVN